MALPTPVATVLAKLRVAMVANKGVAARSFRKDRLAAALSLRRVVETIVFLSFSWRRSILVGCGNGLSNEIGGAGDRPFDQDAANFGRRMTRIAFHAIFAVAGLQPAHVDHRRVDRQ